MSKKRWSIAYSGKNIALIDKNGSSEVLNTNYTGDVKIKVYYKIKPERR
jgi:hypothetical protein